MVGFRIQLSMVALLGLAVGGCGGGTTTETPATNGTGDAHADHENGHTEPKTLAEAVETLSEANTELAEAYKAADVKAVDNVWHEVYPVAKKTKELISNAGLDRYDEEDAQAAQAQLIEVLEKLHPPHGADAKVDPAAYDAEADSLKDAINNLRTASDKAKASE